MSNTVKGLANDSQFYTDAYTTDSGDYENWDSDLGEYSSNYASEYEMGDQYTGQSGEPAPTNPGAAEAMGAWEDFDNEGQEAIASFQKECQSLILLIEENQNLSPEQQAELIDELKQLQAKADLHPEMVDQYQESLEKLREGYETTSAYSSQAVELADRFGRDPEEIENLAKQYGLDLRHLPKPANDAVMKFLAELDPSIGEAVDAAKKAVDDKVKKDTEMVAKANERNALATMNNRDLDSTDLSSYEYLLQAQTGEDEASLMMKERLNDLGATMTEALRALYPDGGGTAEPSAMADAFGIEPPMGAPELVPMAWDGKGSKHGGNFDKLEWPAWVDGYPKLEYNGRAN